MRLLFHICNSLFLQNGGGPASRDWIIVKMLTTTEGDTHLQPDGREASSRIDFVGSCLGVLSTIVTTTERGWGLDRQDENLPECCCAGH